MEKGIFVSKGRWGEAWNFTNKGVTVGPDPLQERLDLWPAVWEQGRDGKWRARRPAPVG